MKVKKSEQQLLSALENVQKLASTQTKLAEKKMNALIQKALKVYKDELDPNLAQFYYEYGNILLQQLEEKDELDNAVEKKTDDNPQLVTIDEDNDNQNDKQKRDLKDAQLAWENLETSRSIIQRQLNILQGEYDDLQEKLIKIRETKLQWQDSLVKSLKRIADLDSWYFVIRFRKEDYKEALEGYENILKLTRNQKELAQIHGKIANVVLQYAQPECETKALKHFQTSFKLCVESCKIDLGFYDLNNEKSIQQLRERIQSSFPENDVISLLLLLLDNIEVTLSQEKEARECRQEIERWKNNQFSLEGDRSQPQKIQTNDQFEPVEGKKVIHLGVFGSARRVKPETPQLEPNIIKKVRTDEQL